MRKTTLRKFTMLLLVLSLVASFSLPLQATEGKVAQNQGTQTNTISLSPPITVQGKSTISLSNIYAVPGREGQILAFSLELHNKDTQEINFNDYWVRLASKNGTRYPVNIVEEGKKNRILPGQKQIYTFYANIPTGLKVEDVVIRFIKWDFSLASFEREIGKFQINADGLTALGKTATKSLALTNGEIEGTMTRGVTVGGGEAITVSYQLKLVNNGFLSQSLPAYQFVLVTKEGYVYPLNASESAGTTVLPRMTRKITVSGEVPNIVDPNTAKVYVLNPIGGDENGTGIPVALFENFGITTEPLGDTTSIGTAKEIILVDDGKARVTLTQVQRLPWDSRDLISAQVIIENTGTKTFAIPKLEGKFILDKTNELSAEVTLDSAKSTLNPTETVSYFVTGYLPYTTTFHEVNVQLKESDGSGVVISKIPVFHFASGSLSVPNVAVNTPFEIGGTGEKKTIQVQETHVYSSWNDDIIATRVEVKNLERRTVNNIHLTGFYTDGNGSLYAAEEVNVAKDILPNGSAMITLWTKVPKGVDKETLQLTLGQAIGNPDGDNALANGMKNGINFALSLQAETGKKSITDLEIYPFKVSFKGARANIVDVRSKNYVISFRYEIDKVSSVVTDTESKLIIEVTDPYGNIMGNKSESIPLEGDNAWRTGRKMISLDSVETITNNVNINVYEEFKGARRLIGKQSIPVYWSKNEGDDNPEF